MSLWQIKALPVPQLLSHNALVVVWVTNKPKYIRFTQQELLPHWGIELLTEWYWVKVRKYLALGFLCYVIPQATLNHVFLIYILQVTRSGEFVIDLDSPHKKPYETLIIGRFKSSKSSDDNPAESCLSDPKTTDKTTTVFGMGSYEKSVEGTMVSTAGDECRHLDKCRGNNGLKCIPNHMVICSVPCQIHSRKPPLLGKHSVPTETVSNKTNRDIRLLMHLHIPPHAQ